MRGISTECTYLEEGCSEAGCKDLERDKHGGDWGITKLNRLNHGVATGSEACISE